MPTILPHIGLALAFAALTSALLAVPAGAQPGAPSGTLATSGSAGAQRPFRLGLVALHNFQYSEAAEHFREAQRADPGFALAYWGEAMSHHHPLWNQHDALAGREALGRLAPTSDARTARAGLPHEKALLRAAEALFAGDDVAAGMRSYAEEMDALHRSDTTNIDVAALAALSLLATAPPGSAGVPARMRAAALLERTFARSPDHPGVAHYLIHAYDDPQHAPLGVRAAEVYARLAPGSPHAQHMPSHIFVQLGRWTDAARANQIAYDASVRLQTARGWSLERRDYHSLLWLGYALLQQGRRERAAEVLEHFRLMAEQASSASVRGGHRVLHALHTIEVGGWARAPGIDAAREGSAVSRANILLAVGIAAFHRRDVARLATAAAAQRALARSAAGADSAQLTVVLLQLEGLERLARGDREGGLRSLQEAAAAEGRLPLPVGIPTPIKPAGELYAEELLQGGRAAEAMAGFRRALERTPRRASSLLGLARAAARAGDGRASLAAYADLLDAWHEADPGTPGLDEARRAIAAADPRSPAREDTRVTLRPLRGSVHLVTADAARGRVNAVASIGPDGVLLVDALVGGLASPVRARLAAAGAGDIRLLVDTHYHSDHTDGNRDLGHGAAIVASAATRAHLVRGDAPSPTPALGEAHLPGVLVADSADLHLNGERVRLLHAGAGHTGGDVVALFHAARVAHVGDIALARGALPYARDVEALAAAIAMIVRRAGRDWIVVPGHGEPMTVANLEALGAIIRETREFVRRAVDAGRGVSDIRREAAARWASWDSRFLEVGEWVEQLHREARRAPSLLVVNRSAHEVALVDATSHRVSVRFPTGEGPHEAAVSADGATAFVPAFGIYPKPHEEPAARGEVDWVRGRGGSLTIIDLLGRSPPVTRDLAGCARPHGVAAAASGEVVWVTCEEERQVWELDARTGARRRAFDTGQEGSHVLLPDARRGRLWVANVGSGSVTAIETATGRRRTVATRPGAEGLALSPDGRELWVANARDNSVSVIDTERHAVIATIASGGRSPVKLTFVPGRGEVWVVNNGSGSLAVFDAATRAPLASISLGTTPLGIAAAPDGSHVYVSAPRDNQVFVLDVARREVVATFRPGIEPDGLAWVR